MLKGPRFSDGPGCMPPLGWCSVLQGKRKGSEAHTQPRKRAASEAYPSLRCNQADHGLGWVKVYKKASVVEHVEPIPRALECDRLTALVSELRMRQPDWRP